MNLLKTFRRTSTLHRVNQTPSRLDQIARTSRISQMQAGVRHLPGKGVEVDLRRVKTRAMDQTRQAAVSKAIPSILTWPNMRNTLSRRKTLQALKCTRRLNRAINRPSEQNDIAWGTRQVFSIVDGGWSWSRVEVLMIQRTFFDRHGMDQLLMLDVNPPQLLPPPQAATSFGTCLSHRRSLVVQAT